MASYGFNPSRHGYTSRVFTVRNYWRKVAPYKVHLIALKGDKVKEEAEKVMMLSRKLVLMFYLMSVKV